MSCERSWSPFLLLALILAAPVHSQQYPIRPVRFVVPFAPGGSVDTLARTIGPRLADALGQQIVVDNRPGGNGNIGMEVVAQARPDGHALVLGYQVRDCEVGEGGPGLGSEGRVVFPQTISTGARFHPPGRRDRR